MRKLTFALYIAATLLCINSYAQQQLSKLDLNNASQTYGEPIVGKSVTGEEAIVAGEKCNDAVGVYPQNIIAST
jgi:hypothetical protein